MDVKDIFDLIKDVKPGVWKIGVTYKKPFDILKAGKAAGYVKGDFYKVVFRWCSANINRENTAAYQQDRANAIARAEEKGKVFEPRNSGFHDSEDENELNIIEYSDRDNKPCLILKKGPHADKVKYYSKDGEISLEEVKELVANKIITSTALNEAPANKVFNLYPEKVQSLKIDGILHEELEEEYMNEANTFKGIAIPDEDGLMEEIIREGVDNIAGDYDIDRNYSDEDKKAASDYSERRKYRYNQNDEDSEIVKGTPKVESLNRKPSRRVTEAMEHEARKYGYKNYKEYERANK